MRCPAPTSDIYALVLAGLLSGGIACAGGSHASHTESPSASAAPAPTAGSQPGAQSDQEAALARLQARQEEACSRVGEVLFICSVEDARDSMPPEEFAKLRPEQLAPQYRKKFMDACLANAMSLRQVEVYEDCLADTTCTVFVPCLDAAQPRSRQ